MREGFVKQEVLKILAPEVANFYRNLPPAAQALPIRTYFYYRGPNFLDMYMEYFDIPNEVEHARNTLSLMRMDTTTTDNCFERLQQVKQFVDSDPSTGYDIAVDAFLNAYRSINSEVTLSLRSARFRHRTFESYFREAKVIALRGSMTSVDGSGGSVGIPSKLPLDTNTSASQSNTKSPTTSKRRYTWEEKQAYWKKRREDRKPVDRPSVVNTTQSQYGINSQCSTSSPYIHQAQANSMSSQAGSTPNLTQSILNALNQLIAGQHSSQVTQATTYQPQQHTALVPYQSHVVNYQAPSHVNQLSSHGGGYSSSSRSYSKGSNRYSNSKSSTPGHYSRAASIPIKPNPYEHNPVGHEPWKKWFRVCGNCRQWGAHFAKECREPTHPDNTINPPNYRSPIPLVAYPKDLSQANALAQREHSIYGDGLKWNCRPEQQPRL
jgi:hypothetical protein